MMSVTVDASVIVGRRLGAEVGRGLMVGPGVGASEGRAERVGRIEGG
jgi:hypothetical protein